MKKPIGTEISIRELWYIIKKKLTKFKKLSKEQRKKHNGEYIVRSSK